MAVALSLSNNGGSMSRLNARALPLVLVACVAMSSSLMTACSQASDAPQPSNSTAQKQSNGTSFDGAIPQGCQVIEDTVNIHSQADLQRFADLDCFVVDDHLFVQDSSDITDLSALHGLRAVSGYIGISDNDALQSASLPNLTEVGQGLVVEGNGALTSLSADALTTDAGVLHVFGDASLASVSFASLTGVGDDVIFAGLDALTSLDLSRLAMVSGRFLFEHSNALQCLCLPSLAQVAKDFVVHYNGALASVSAPQLSAVGGNIVVQRNPQLQVLDMPAISSVGGDLQVLANQKLAQCAVDDVSAAVQSLGGNIRTEGNSSTCPQPALTPQEVGCGACAPGPSPERPDAGQPDGGGLPDAGMADAAQPDVSQPDASQPDAAQPDAAQPDAAQPDAGAPDVGDTGQPDTGGGGGPADVGQPDTAQPDTGQPDTGGGGGGGLPDTGQPDTGQPDTGGGQQGGLSIISASLEDNPNSTISTYLNVQTSTAAFLEVQARSSDHNFTLTFDRQALAQRHQLLIGFRAQHTYQLTVRAYTSGGAQATRQLQYTTGALPSDLDNIDVTVDKPSQMASGFTLFNLWRWSGPGQLDSSVGYIVALDNEGKVVWYYQATNRPTAVIVLQNGDIAYNWGFGHIVEIDLAGNVVRDFSYQDLGLNAIHHDVYQMPNGHLLTLSSEVRQIGGYTDDQGNPTTYNVVGDVIVEFTMAGQVVHKYHLLDLLDPHRMTSSFDATFWDSWYGESTKDWAHANSVVYDPRDDSYIVSLRHLNMVVKVDRATGQLVWRLGENTDFSLTSGDWFYHEHAVDLLDNGNIIMFDNGNGRPGLSPSEYYSRAVEYSIDASGANPATGSQGTAQQVWQFQDTQPFYSSFLGDANLLDNGDVLIADGGRFEDIGSAQNLATARLVEVTHTANPQKVFEVYFHDFTPPQIGYSIYRALRVDLLGVLESK